MTYKLPVKFDKGSGDKVIVLLHGLGNNASSWQFVQEHLDYAQYRVIALDLLGFGDAPKPTINYTPAAHADAVVTTLNDLNIQHATIAGHSMGCIVALEVARAHPDLAQNLALFGAPIYKQEPRSDWWARVTRSGGLYFKIFSIVKKNPDAVQAGGQIADNLLPFVKGMEITEETWPAYRSSLEHTIMQYQTYKDAMMITTPTLLVNGLFDMFIIRKNNRIIAHKNPHARAKTTLGPHELTPRQGKTVAHIIQTIAKSN